MVWDDETLTNYLYLGENPIQFGSKGFWKVGYVISPFP